MHTIGEVDQDETLSGCRIANLVEPDLSRSFGMASIIAYASVRFH